MQRVKADLSSKEWNRFPNEYPESCKKLNLKSDTMKLGCNEISYSKLGYNEHILVKWVILVHKLIRL